MQLLGNGSGLTAFDNNLVILGSCMLTVCLSVFWALERSARWGTALKLPRAVKALPTLTAEVFGLAMLIALITALLSRGRNLGSPISTREDKELWTEMVTEWPLLQTADSLLAIQAMLRFLVVASLALRGDALGAPISGVAAIFLTLAGVCRVWVLVLSPPDVYHFDGPLGGALNTLFEVAVFPPLLYLGLALSRPSSIGWLGVLGICPVLAMAAQHNRFALADDSQGYLDTLFSIAQLCELLTAVSVSGRLIRLVVHKFICSPDVDSRSDSDAEGACSIESYVRAGFAHCILPVQALLATYFHLVAFAPPGETPAALVREGKPFEMMRIGGAVQVGLYLLAAVLHFSCGADFLWKGEVLLDV